MEGKKIIFLTGPSGAGKSTLAKNVASANGFACLVLSEYVEGVGKGRGFRDLDDFEKRVGLKEAYFDLIPTLIKEIGRQLAGKSGIVIEGVYDPFLYERIKRTFGRADTYLFSVSVRRRERERRIQKREGQPVEERRKSKRVRDWNKKIIGLNAIMRHSDAINLKHESTQQIVRQIIETISGPPRTSATAARRQLYARLKEKTRKAHQQMKTGKLRYRYCK